MNDIGQLGNMLGLGDNSRATFSRLVEYVLEKIPTQKIISAEYTSELREKYPPIQRGHIFDIPLAGRKQIIFSAQGRSVKVEMMPGDIFYTPPLCWKFPIWETPHEMSAFIFNTDFIRLTYINIPHPMAVHELPDIRHYYHTRFPPDKEMNGVLQTMQLLSVNGDAKNAAPDLVRGLFRLLWAKLEREDPPIFSKGQITYQRILQYLRDHFHAPINREHVAKVFKLHPGYLSRLFKENSDGSFHEVLTAMRMEQAAFLLQHTDLLIDEVSDRCGYVNPSLFYVAFKRHFGEPPGKFRRIAYNRSEE